MTSLKGGYRDGQLCNFSLKTNLNEYGPYSVTNSPDCGNDFTQIPVEGDFSEFLRSNIILDDTVGREDWIIGFQVPSKLNNYRANQQFLYIHFVFRVFHKISLEALYSGIEGFKNHKNSYIFGCNSNCSVSL